MATNIIHKKPFVKETWLDHMSPGQTTITSGQCNTEWEYDDKPATTVRNQMTNGWRSPSGYTRNVKSGMNAGCILKYANTQFYLDGRIRYWGRYSGAFDGNGYLRPSMPDFPEKLTGRAVNDALLKLKDQKINLAVAFGERKETAKFVTDTVDLAAKVARAVRKKDVKRVKELLLRTEPRSRNRPLLQEVLDAPSRLVLTNAYAFQPLVGDAYGAVEELNRRDLEHPERYTVRGISYKKEDIRINDDRVFDIAGAQQPMRTKLRGFHSAKVRLDYYVENPFLRSLAQLGITNPAVLAWELLPLSFVFDWLLPIGDYLDAWDATLGLAFRGGTCSRLTQIRVSHAFNGRPYLTTSSLKLRLDTAEIVASGGKYNRLVRSVYTESPLPVYPSFNESIWSYQRLSSALALLAQAVR